MAVNYPKDCRQPYFFKRPFCLSDIADAASHGLPMQNHWRTEIPPYYIRTPREGFPCRQAVLQQAIPSHVHAR